ncbi:MAG: aspartate aminotransferase family protein [Bacteroidia bacterium]|nr:aspartate aminotransferase family protein [Bacteroidia bacterium]
MYTYWKKKSHDEIKQRVFAALRENINYNNQNVLGIPASYLDNKVFNQDDSFLQNAPFITTLIKNPNHIGCHTLGNSEHYFKGTQEIEKELIEICAVDILNGEPNKQDGYVASGGTEANIQAIWIYRNYFENEFNAKREEIAILCSEDSHYSMDKASNLLGIDIYKVNVNQENRELSNEVVKSALDAAKKDGKKYFAVIVNMMTTMYGSIDNIDFYIEELEKSGCQFKIHIDGAYGGFYYPFTKNKGKLTFQNKHITSFTLDAHKMAQAPYGTGIFLIRKGYIEHANTKASYVEGEDFTLIGSRSGANAIAVWMILCMNGPFGWQEKVFILQRRSEWLSAQLRDLGIEFYNHAMSNIITLKSEHVSPKIASNFGLVPDNHEKPNWYKIVLMDHVTIEKLMPLLDALKS